ncbi:hypothetical protein EDB81DRAFT_925353 [Dactylonectria macrodidyma]|uniref:Protein kinase domain-containing protein n=1 Tax=Dactylonectria macrodidyma TaxID=307937 RepID=A0A9P9JK35_9HYPO|nr:hypothetical protein EDB81DRAFT_925353 [Dactylonectria macrodidyma]
MTEGDLKLGTGANAGLAVFLPASQTAFLERHSYTRESQESEAVLEDILKLGHLLRGQPVTEGLLSLQLYGLVQLKGEIRFIYKLPPAIAAHWRGGPSDDVSVRRPVHLSQMLSPSLDSRDKSWRPPLGLRFELAWQLVRAIIFLHASGWLHKNIRPESVVFFREPNENSTGDNIANGVDLDHPFLLGYEYSRPEDTANNETVDPATTSSNITPSSTEKPIQPQQAPPPDSLPLQVPKPESRTSQSETNSSSPIRGAGGGLSLSECI